jgi:hypothetical protein
MKLVGKTCYTQLLWLMCSGENLQQAASKVTFKSPDFNGEGFNGYIETDYEIEIKDLKLFANIWNSWYSLTEKRRIELYGLAKGLGDCK